MVHMEETVRGYDGMSTNPMPDDINCATMIGICPSDLKECFSMSTEEFVYSEPSGKATTWMERKRDQHPRNLQKMKQSILNLLHEN